MKKIISLDIDGVFADTIKLVCELLGEEKRNVVYWDYLADKYTKKAFFNAYKKAWESGNIEVQNNNDILIFFKKLRELDIEAEYVTCIPKDCIEYLYKWLDDNELCFCPVKRVDAIKDKVLLNYMYYVDDSPCLNMLTDNTVFLYDQPWNSTPFCNLNNKKKFHRVGKLLDVIRILECGVK